VSEFKEPTVGELEARIQAVRTLQSMPAWKMYEYFLQQQEDILEQGLLTSKDGHNMAMLVGGLRAIKSMQTWAEREIKANQNVLIGQQSG
jgi:hypothetical protein